MENINNGQILVRRCSVLLGTLVAFVLSEQIKWQEATVFTRSIIDLGLYWEMQIIQNKINLQ
jgi:hypothetical protein